MDNIVQEIILKAQKDVFSNNLGTHLTPFKGEGIDFEEIKEYSIGDDIRKINWNATAKDPFGTLQINQFNDERELNIIIAFMVSGNISFGSQILKQDIMNQILAILAYSSIKNNDRYHTVFFSNKIEKEYYPTKNFNLLENIISYGVKLDPLKKEINWGNFCYFINSLKKKSIIFIIGDFFEDNIDLSSIAYKNDVYSLIVRDRLEEDISFSGEYDLIDPISLKTNQQILNNTIISNYKKLLIEHDNKLIEHFLNYKIKYTKIYTHDNIFSKLTSIM